MRAVASITTSRYAEAGKTGPYSMPLVSVIITSYNQRRFVLESIYSAQRQTYPNTEVIVVDDGSTDGSLELLKPLHGVQVISQSNRGVSAARNRGFQESSGEYIVFLDGDDRLAPDAVHAHVQAIRRETAAGLVFGARGLIDSQGSVVSKPYLCFPRRDYFRMFLECNPIQCPAAAMFSREALLLAGPFDADMEPAEDYDMFLRVSYSFHVLRHPAMIAEYRKHGESASQRRDIMLRSSLAVLYKTRRTFQLTKAEVRSVRTGLARFKAAYEVTSPHNGVAFRRLWYRLHALRYLDIPELIGDAWRRSCS